MNSSAYRSELLGDVIRVRVYCCQVSFKVILHVHVCNPVREYSHCKPGAAKASKGIFCSFSVLGSVKAFLPKIAAANCELERKLAADPSTSVDIENTDDCTGEIIEMVRYMLYVRHVGPKAGQHDALALQHIICRCPNPGRSVI